MSESYLEEQDAYAVLVRAFKEVEPELSIIGVTCNVLPIDVRMRAPYTSEARVDAIKDGNIIDVFEIFLVYHARPQYTLTALTGFISEFVAALSQRK